jgi:hypothetical protein
MSLIEECAIISIEQKVVLKLYTHTQVNLKTTLCLIERKDWQ